MKLRPLGDRIVLKYQEAEEEKTQVATSGQDMGY